MRRNIFAAALVALVATTSASVGLAGPVEDIIGDSARPGEWVAGDLHVHTIWGHDTCITPQTSWDNTSTDRSETRPCEDPYTWGFSVAERIAEAEQRGLNFIAITDHNNVMSQSDPAWTDYTGPLVLVPAYENSLAGHVQMLGATSCYGNGGPVTSPVVECQGAVTDQSVSGMNSLMAALRANGGAFQVNHPSDLRWQPAFGISVVPDSLEVWNIGAWFYQPPNLASNNNDFSLDYWDQFLRAGGRVAATGGSDSHWRITDQVQGVGEPTTWVWVTEHSKEGIIAGIRAGRTTISYEPPVRNGARIYLEADADDDGDFESMPGDTVPQGKEFRVRALYAAPGSILRIVTEAGYTEVPFNGLTHRFTSSASDYLRVELRYQDAQDVRVEHCDVIVREIEDQVSPVRTIEDEGTGRATECRNRLVMEALTSPIYIGGS